MTLQGPLPPRLAVSPPGGAADRLPASLWLGLSHCQTTDMAPVEKKDEAKKAAYVPTGKPRGRPKGPSKKAVAKAARAAAMAAGRKAKKD